jgi:stage II sporulation protein M
MIREALSRNKRLILAIISLYILSIPAGYLSYGYIAQQVMPLMQKFIENIEGKSELEMVENIFINNYRVCGLLMLTGAFILPAIVIIFINGFAMGFVVKLLEIKNHGLFFLIKGIVPHGIFELPAIFISAAIGLRIGLSYLTLDNKKRVEDVNKAIKEAVLINFLVVLPLLIIAAFVEVFVSAALLGKTA